MIRLAQLAGLALWVASGLAMAAPQVTIYCTAKVNSAGCTPSIHAAGTPVAGAQGGFEIFATKLLNTKFGLMFYGTSGPANFPFQGGTLCVQPPQVRTDTQNTGGGGTPPCGGYMTLDFNTYTASGVDPQLVAGQTVWAQYWSRDPGFAPPNNTNLTDAVRFTIDPAPPPFLNMVWNNELVPLNNGGSFNHSAILNGGIMVAPNGAPNGFVNVMFDDGSMAMIQQNPSGATFVQTGGSLLDLLTPGTGPGDNNALLNGNPVNLLALLNALQADVNAGVLPIAMPDAERALLALAALGFTQAWQDNVGVAQLAFFGWINWCKVSITIAMGALTVGAVAICGACAAGSVVTLGGIAIPCAALCAGTAFIGLAAAQALLEGLWSP
jgi:hypothetical protein